MDICKFFADNKDIITIWIAIFALVATSTTSVVNVINMNRQRVHYRKSLRPIASISIGDYENTLFVTLQNDGPGVMIVSNIEVLKSGTDEKKSALKKFMPLGLTWDTYVNDIRERAFASGKDIQLVSISQEHNNKSWPNVRDSVRASLAPLSVKVEYRSIYDEVFCVTRSLDWFGRTKDGPAEA